MSLPLPLTLSIKDTAAMIGFNRNTVTVLCDRGEIAIVPAVLPDGSRSRTRKHAVTASVLEWVRKNTVRSPEDLKKVVDGRRR